MAGALPRVSCFCASSSGSGRTQDAAIAFNPAGSVRNASAPGWNNALATSLCYLMFASACVAYGLWRGRRRRGDGDRLH